ncbi:tRNA-splicing ligase RtcB [Kribbella orskensis]|uniref:3'-phosphate/5'-hydroxy nucleic acid ligase n=1 Tax=Kribbella orskensis TaxID=2512216 RepID=A0ABY2B8H2_9ACTN|nr:MULTISPECIES: RtcB family protein [Kribbella]TCN31178.1 tRNA-splicing ligase RtcB [Kribbella sp. VKM Ac-2500]TCO11684.1 tRNA-splicing ligase RtcB [Kribbella orskensis]
MNRYGIWVPDRQLACAPVDSPEGRAYLGAMAASANYGRANRQLLSQAVRRVFATETGASLDLVYDVSHNLAKLEEHDLDGVPRTLCVHRKGATRALPPGHPDLPEPLRAVGQPVLIPGTMGTASYVLTGVPGGPRSLHRPRCGPRRQPAPGGAIGNGQQLRDDLEKRGIMVRGSSWRGLAEEAPTAYKDVTEVVATSHRAGLARPVARLVPIGVVKG